MGIRFLARELERKTGKRLLAFCLAVVLSLCALPAYEVYATETETQNATQTETQNVTQNATQNGTQNGAQDNQAAPNEALDFQGIFTNQMDNANNQAGETLENDDGTEDGSASDREADADKENVIQTVSWETPTLDGSSDPTLPAPSVEEMISATQSNPAEDNIYTLTVATGIKPGETVHYFAIRYTDANGGKRTAYIFPHLDAFQMSYNYMAEKGGENGTVTKRHEILRELGYEINEPSGPVPLSAWSVDEYLFKADYGLTSVDSIEVFLAGGTWSVQGMSVSQVTSFAGYGEYGFYSGKYFFGIGKKKLAELENKKVGAKSISANGDTLINIGGNDSAYFGLKTVKDGDGETDTLFDDLYSIRMDFLDKLDAGIETIMKDSASDIDPANGLVEDLAVQIEYKDTNGWTRNVVMPVLLSAVGQYKQFGDNIVTAGLCQRGDTIAFTACLPEFLSIVSAKIYVGTAARDVLEAEGGIKKVDGIPEELKSALDSDSIALAGMSLYSGTCRMSNINNGVDSTTGKEYQSLTTAYSFSESSPFMYYTVQNKNGMRVNGNSSETVAMKKYDSKDPLISTETEGNYIIRLHTDSMDAAATKNSIYVRLTYSTASGVSQKTARFDSRKLVQEFMGYWPSINDKKGEFAYYYGADKGGTLEFPIDLPEATGISNVEVSLGSESEDEWQMNGLSVAFVSNIGHRRIYLRPMSAQGDNSPFMIVRTMDKSDIPPFPLGIQKLFKANGRDSSDSWDVSTGQSTGGNELNYSSMRYSMSYEQTQMNLGFVNSEKVYDVTVSVADDSDVSNENGDSGSTNQFFFQLMFKNGNSAVVLANQQLSADGFRAGVNENFTIAVNRDYGTLTGVRIIPEDVTSDSEIFDKLNIDKITVTENSNGGAAMQYIIDNVGWIGIDYHDEAENSSIKGREGRLMSDLASRYAVSAQRHVVNILCEVMTLPWEMENYMQVEASICCDLVYIDTNQQPQTMSFDVIKRMAMYMDKTAISYDAPTDPNNSAAKYYKNMTTISDPEWMLRPNHTDRFILPAIPNLQTIKSMTFYATSRNNKPGQWVIGDLAISQVIDDGPVSLTADNEYYRDMSTQAICKMDTDKDKLSLFLPAGEMETLKIDLTENQLVWAEDDSWVSPVTRIPEGEDDTLNIYVYPTADSRNIEGTPVNFAVQYAMSFTNPQQTKGALIPIASGTEDACYMASDVRASGMATLNSLSVRCTNERMGFDHAVVQQIREGVVVNTYYLNFNNSSALFGVTVKPSSIATESEPREQVVYLSFGMDTQEATLFAEDNDIAVAFKYRSSLDNGAKEYYSPYTYLTDMGIGKIYPGMMAEITFNIPYVTEITGYRIGSFGGVVATVEGAVITNNSYSSKTKNETTGEIETNDLTRLGVYSSGDIVDGSLLVPYAVTNMIIEKQVTAQGMTGDRALNPLDITFTTAGALSTGESGTQAPVQMVFNYYDQAGATKSRIVNDISKYIQGEDKIFKTGGTARVRLLLPECKELLSIQILPHDDTGSANWAISNISGTLGFGDKMFNRAVNQTFTQAALGTIYIKEVVMTTYYAVNNNGAATVINNKGSAVLLSGDKVSVTVVVADGTGFIPKIYWNVNGAKMDMTGTLIKDLTGTGFYMFGPDNNTGDPQTYSVEVASAANPSIVDEIWLTVYPKDTGSLKDVVEQLKKNDQTVKDQNSTPTPPSTDPSTDPGTVPGTDQSTDQSTDPGTVPGTDPGTVPSTDPSTDPGTVPGTDQSTDQSTDSSTDSGTGGNTGSNTGGSSEGSNP